ncbi:MAG: dihydrofolate reductase family protein [Dehalococcoidia bacterium]
MGRLVYTAIASLDGYIADAEGRFDWSAPDEEVHAALNDLERGTGTMLLGRRMYEVLVAWETMPTADEPPVIEDFARIWRDADKVVYSTLLEGVTSARTRIERTFDIEAVRALKASSERDLSIGGPLLASHALDAGLVDECHVFVNPITVGAGTPAFQQRRRLDLELVSERRFANGVVHLHYLVRS